jgi:hypothetical protein
MYFLFRVLYRGWIDKPCVKFFYYTVQRLRMKRGGGPKCPVLHVNEPKKTGASIAWAVCSLQNLLVKNKRLMKGIRGTRIHGCQGNYANTCMLEHANVCKYQLTGTVSHNSMTQEVGWYDTAI